MITDTINENTWVMIMKMSVKKFYRLKLISVLLLLSVGVMPSSVRASSIPVPMMQSDVDTLIQLINQMRLENGLNALTPNSILMQVAQSHAEYQAATGTITHYSADGTRPFQRALNAGYWVAGDLSQNGWFSENIIGGPGMTPSRAVEAWTGDAPHLNTMLGANYQDIGVGIASDGESWYYTVDTAKPSSVPVAYTPEAQVESSSAPGYIVPVKIATPMVGGSIYHEVQSGQTLWTVSEAYEVDMNQIASLNGRLGSEQIYIGESLLIRPAFTVTPLLPTETSAPRTHTPTRHIPTGTPSAEVEAPLEEKDIGFWVALPVVVVAIVIIVGILRAGLNPPSPPRKPHS